MPAKHSIPPEIKSVVFVDNSIPHRDSMVNKIEVDGEVMYVDTIWNDQFSTIALSSAYEELKFRQFFDTVYMHTTNIKLETNASRLRALNWLRVDSLCKMYGADAVIAFEINNYKTHIKADLQYDGGYYAYMDAYGGILWRGYNNLTKKEMYRETQLDTISWNAVGGSLSGIGHQLPDTKQAYASLAEYMGVKSVSQIAPEWYSEERGYYTAGNYQFLQAEEFINLKKYGEAIKQWKYVYDSAKPKFKARAAYNLSLVSEILGDFKSAQYWLDAAEEVYNDMDDNRLSEDRKKLYLYKLKLNSRLTTIKKLHQQVGGAF